jgi:hypothetical protein
MEQIGPGKSILATRGWKFPHGAAYHERELSKPRIVLSGRRNSCFVELRPETGQSFPVALWATRAGNVFTTHTPVAAAFDPDLLVISPGPGNPSTAGVSLDAVDYFKDKLPIFGVCLGHQTIVQHFGGRISHAPEPMHGKPSRITVKTSLGKAGIVNIEREAEMSGPTHNKGVYILTSFENQICCFNDFTYHSSNRNIDSKCKGR